MNGNGIIISSIYKFKKIYKFITSIIIMNDINLIADKIKKNGYYIIKNYIPQSDCQKIINHIKNNTIPSYNTGEGGDIRVSNYQKYSNIATKFLNDKFFLQIGAKLLGHNADKKTKRCQLGIVKYNNGKECSGGGWHVDRHTRQFKTILYVSDVSNDNGPFAIFSPPLKSKDYPALPGRKNTRFSDEIAIKFNDRLKILTGNAGDVILVDTSNIHRGTIIKKGGRTTLTNYYYD